MADPQLNWSSWREAARVIAHRPFLKKTVATALVVGTVLFLINHLDEVLAGEASAATYVKGLATCAVPFAVSNWGILVATRRR